ncbi:hypothetical protein [Xanthomonas sp. LMG 12460]|uniref:hypothetical protein n=1 Tax=Xanthomonas sp. LMG 12460 TaxID=1591132 RepID=UPI001263FF21|nr:hypothetical protein [Xanthomonas sp. LMG 12460]KAB7779170.1 hypothetical protein CEK66_07200 [Xanthomonas sp. LMG 12460]
MIRHWPALLGTLLGLAGSAGGRTPEQTPAQDPAPQRVALAQSLTAPCVSIVQDTASIGLQRDVLERAAAIARTSPTAPHGNEAQRLAWIAGTRAQALLDAAEGAGVTRDRFGCNALAYAKVPADSLYLVGQLLEHGQAAVWLPASGRFAATVDIRRDNTQCQRGPMGSLAYRVDDEKTPLLFLVACVT